jgi:exo-beta-1,3-glucanase (GH17 family)/cellulose synthase/poly-beta-1,6-N-acetylglucosamine synthase-like glycosyltransferase
MKDSRTLKTKISRVNILIAVAVAALSISLWALTNRPAVEPTWPSIIQGFSFSPMRAHNNPIEGLLPTPEEINEDLALLKEKTHAVRTYGVGGSLAEIPSLAQKHSINVTLGAEISTDMEKNSRELLSMITIADRHRHTVVRVIVGNESILREDVTPEQLIKYLKMARMQLDLPVSTAEPWHVWVKHPELAENVDYLAVHMLPYWEGVQLDDAVNYIVDRMNDLKALYPGKPIVITEVGWPSNGRTRKGAVASKANEAIFLRRFLQRAEQENYVYYLMEAFDQTWKAENEGAVGAYWGVYDVDRQPKFEFSEDIVSIPQWHILAGISVFIAAITFSLLLVDAMALTFRGRSFLAAVAFFAATAVVWIIYSYTQQYFTLSSIIVGIFMLIGMIGVVIVLLIEAHEWAETIWVHERRRPFTPVPVDDESLPMVSIHVPAYNEPPDMMIETLNALAKLNYPRFEVIVIDNNTKDPAVWQPVEKHCKTLGEKFRFFHKSPLEGFKSGALNFALAQTVDSAEIVAVIDSDYIVEANWLRDLAPQFLDADVAIVQAPQDYRDADENAFKAMSHAEYRGFFYIGMVTRNERNAIIQHGTMTMVRRNVLEQSGRWSEWCITEDAELGLRIFEMGFKAVYIPKSYGKGLIPDTFLSYKRQRSRWAYGAVQIMKHHARELFTRNDKLTTGQRYHFVAGWLPWMADGMNLLFNVAAIGWSIAMIAAPLSFDPPLIIFSLLPLVLFCFKMAKLISIYRSARIVGTAPQTIAAALAGLALSYTIAIAMVQGLLTKDKPFSRTPKMAQSAALLRALDACREEALFAIMLWTAAAAIVITLGTETMDLLLWVIVLLVQSLPYMAALMMSIISAYPKMSAKLICGGYCSDDDSNQESQPSHHPIDDTK